MIIVLNGYPGVGKLTTGRVLADILGGKLLDIHTVYNVAFALTEFKTPEFREAVERVEEIAHGLVLKLPAGIPVVLTTVIAGDGEWGNAEWKRLEDLGAERPPFCVIHLSCDLEENIRRIGDPGRDGMRKPRDPDMARRNQEQAKPLAGLAARHLLKLDTTGLSAQASAQRIADWIDGL
ncbi:MAG: AAA family ATPase [Pseudomonadota bacterium]